MLTLSVPLLAIFLLGFFFYGRIKINAAFAPLLSICCIMLFMVLGSGFALLPITRISAYIIIAAASIYSFIKFPHKFKEYALAPSTLAFLIGALVLAFLFIRSGSFYDHWDEYSHWGPAFKIVYEYDAIYQHTTLDFLVHSTYPQGSASLYYFYALLSPGFSEADTHIVMGILLCAAFAVLLQNCTWKKPVPAVFAIVATPFFFVLFPETLPYGTVLHDTLLGALFGALLVIATSPSISTDATTPLWKHTFVIAVVSAAVAQIKVTGAPLAIVAAIFYGLVLLSLGNKESFAQAAKLNFNKSWIAHIATCIGAVGVSFTFWRIVLFVTGFAHDKFSSSSARPFFKTIAESISKNNTFALDVSKSFWHNILRAPVVYNGFGTSLLSALLLTLFSVLVGAWFYHRKKQQGVALTLFYMPSVFVLYMIFLFYTYMSRMNEMEALTSSSFTRYTATFFVGWVMFILAIILLYLQEWWKHLPTITLAGIIFLMANTLAQRDILELSVDWSVRRKNFDTVSQQMLDVLQPNDDLWVIAMDDGGEMQRYMFGYTMIPARTSTRLPYRFSSTEIPTQQMKETAITQGVDYILVYVADDDFVQNYAHLFSDSLHSNLASSLPSLYKVNLDKNSAFPFDLVLQTVLNK